MLPSRRRSSRLSRESMKGGRRRSSSNKAMDDDEEVVWTSSSEEEPEEDFDLAEYQRLDRERKDAIGRRQRQLIEQRQREEEAKGKQTVEPSAAGSSTFPSATVDSGESVESFDLEEYRQKDIEKHTARQREARKRAESRNAKEKADKAKPAELSSDSDSDESDTEDTPEAKKAKKTGKKPPAAKKAPAVPHERVESLFAKQMDKYKNDIPKELFTSSPKPPPPKKQPLPPPQAVSTARRSTTQGTSDKENNSAEQQRLETETEVVTKKLSASATRSSTTNLTKQPNNPVVEQEQDEESDEVEIIETPRETVKAKVPLFSHILTGRETLSRDRDVSPSQNQGSFLTSTPSQKTNVGLSQGLSQSIALSPLQPEKDPKMRHLILTQKVHQKASRLPVRVQAPPARIEDEASQPPVPVQAELPANQSRAVENQQKARKSRASIAPQVKNGTFEVSHGFGGVVPRIQRTPHGNPVATAEEEDNGEIVGVSEEGEDFPDEFPQTDSDGQNENEKGEGAPETSPEQVANSPTKPLRKSKGPPPLEEVEDAPATNVQSRKDKDKTLPLPAKVTEEEKEVRTSKARTSFVRRLDRTFTAAEHAQGASTSRQAIQNQQKKDETFPVGAAGPCTSPVIIDVPNEEDIVPPEKSPSPPKHAATKSRPSKKGKEAPVIKLPTRKSKRDKGPPSTAAVFEEEEAPASTAQPFERSPEDLFEDSDEDDGAQRPSTSRQTIQNQQKKDETFPVGAAAAGPSTSPVIIDVPNEEVAVERPAKRDTRSRASKKREGVPTVTLPIKKSKQGKAPPPPEPEPEVPPETRATRSGASKKPAVKLPTKKSKAKAPPPPTVIEEQEEEEMEAPTSSVRHQEKALPKEVPQPADDGERPSTSRQAIEKQQKNYKTTPAVADGEKEKEEMTTEKLSRRTTRSQVSKPEAPKGKSKQDKVPPPPEPEEDEAPASSKVSKKRKAKAAIEVQSSKKAKKDRVSVPPPIPEEMEIEDEEGDIVSPQTTDVMAKAGPSTTSPPKSTKSKAGSARRRQRLESDSDEEEAAPAKPSKQVTRPKGKGATVVTSSAKTSKKARPPVAVVSEEEEEDDEEQEVVATSSKAKSSTAGTPQKALSQPSEDDDQRPSTSRQAIEKQQKKNKSSTVVAGPSSSITSLSQRSNLSNAASHVSASRRPSYFQTLREARAGSVQPTTSAAATAVKKAKKKVRNRASTSNREETPERYVGNDVFGNYHMLQEEDFKQILNAEKPDHGLSAEEVQQMSLKVNHFLEDFFTFHCNETEHFYGFIPFLEMKQALIDQCLLEEDCTDEDFLVIMKQNFTKEAWKKGEGILYPSRYDMKHPPDTSDYLYK